MDSDSIYTTNQPEIVEHARYCNENYLTIENNIPMSKNVYNDSPESFAKVDSALMKANTAIGESSNLAQLALTYSYNYNDSNIENSIAILSVLAQIAIDSSKRVFEVDFISEIKRLKKELKVDTNGLPLFWFMLKRKNRFAKGNNKADQKEQQEKKKMEHYNPHLVCPMNFVCETSFFPERTSEETLPMEYFFQSYPLKSQKRVSQNLERFIEEYCTDLANKMAEDEEEDYKIGEEEFEEMMDNLRRCYIPDHAIGVVSNLLDRAFRISSRMKTNQGTLESNLWRNKPVVVKILYGINKKCLFNCLNKNIMKNITKD